jgi:hypothetical protein
MRRHLPLLLLGCLTSFPVHAQDDSGTNSSQTNKTQVQQGPYPREGALAFLTKEEKVKLKEAHDQAIQNDPSLDQNMKSACQAMESAIKALRESMIKADPSVAPILDKISERKEWHWGHPNGDNKGWFNKSAPSSGTNSEHANTAINNTSSTNAASAKGFRHDGYGMPPGFASLTPEEKSQLKSVHEKVNDDPAVVAAREVEKNATTPEARFKARQSANHVMHDAMIKADPSIEPILEKVFPPAPPPESSGGQSKGPEESPMMPPQ